MSMSFYDIKPSGYYKMSREQRSETFKTLKKHGYRLGHFSTTFPYRDGVLKEKTTAKSNADSLAKRVEDITGIKCEVEEGFFA